MTYEIVKDAINSFGVPVAILLFLGFVFWRGAVFFSPLIRSIMDAIRKHIEVSAEQLPKQTEILQSLATQSSDTHATVKDIHQILSPRQSP